jgi:hypothetical protein
MEWLERSAGQDDCVLASNATKALLSLHAADTLHSCSSVRSLLLPCLTDIGRCNPIVANRVIYFTKTVNVRKLTIYGHRFTGVLFFIRHSKSFHRTGSSATSALKRVAIMFLQLVSLQMSSDSPRRPPRTTISLRFRRHFRIVRAPTIQFSRRTDVLGNCDKLRQIQTGLRQIQTGRTPSSNWPARAVSLVSTELSDY